MSGPCLTARVAAVLAAMLFAAGSVSSADLDGDPPPARSLHLPHGSDFNLRMPRVCHEDILEHGYYPPAPRYVYDNRRGATWTGNGWVYLPVGEHAPDPQAPRLEVQTPPHGFHPGEIVMIPCRVIKRLPDYLPFDLPLK